MKQEFTNPYSGCRSLGPVIKIGADIPEDEFNAVRRVRLREGTMTTIITILWKRLVDECKRRNFIDFTSTDDFEEFVSECRLLLPGEPNPASGAGAYGSAASGTDGPTPPPPIGGAVKGVSPAGEVPSAKPPVLQGVHAKGSTAGGSGAAKSQKGKATLQGKGAL